MLRRLADDGLKLEFEEAPFGGAGFDAHGDPLPESTLKLAKAADAVLCGAVGGPKYDALPRPQRPEQGILRIRKELGLFANLRPAELDETGLPKSLTVQNKMMFARVKWQAITIVLLAVLVLVAGSQ